MKRCWAAGVHVTWEHSEHAVFRPTLFLSVSFCHWLIYVRSSPSIQRRCFSRLSSRQRGRIKDSFITALSPHWQPNCSEGEILTFSVHCPCGRNPTTEHWTQQHRLLFFFFFSNWNKAGIQLPLLLCFFLSPARKMFRVFHRRLICNVAVGKKKKKCPHLSGCMFCLECTEGEKKGYFTNGPRKTKTLILS